MVSCPACGTPVPEPDDTPLCPRCGRDLTAPAAPVLSRGEPIGQDHGTGPSSPALRFARQVATGRWDGAAAVVAAPVAALFGLVLLIAVRLGDSVPSPAGGGTFQAAAGLGTRFRFVLAVLLQGLGGSLKFTHVLVNPPGNDLDNVHEDGSTYTIKGGTTAVLHSHMSVPLWTVTLVWVLALVLALRALRRRRAAAGAPAGAHEAVRVALTAAAAALALALLGEVQTAAGKPDTSPVLVASWTFLLTLGVALFVLCRPSVDAWLAARPLPGLVLRALGSAVTALLATLLLAGAVVWVIAAAHHDDVTGWGLAAAALLLVGLGVSGQGLAWGVPFDVRATVPGNGRSAGHFHRSFGLSDLSDVWNTAEVAAVVAGGIACALLIGLLAVRRSRSRAEMFTVAGWYTVLFAAMAALGGASAGSDGGVYSVVGREGHQEVGSSVPQALALGVLWSFGGVLIVWSLWRVSGRAWPAPSGARGGEPAAAAGPFAPAEAPPAVPPAAPPVPPRRAPRQAPPVPAHPPAPPRDSVIDLGVVQPDRLTERQPPRD